MSKSHPYQILFHTNVEDHESSNPSLITSECFEVEPEYDAIVNLMENHNSQYCQCFYDKRGDDQYEELIWEML